MGHWGARARRAAVPAPAPALVSSVWNLCGARAAGQVRGGDRLVLRSGICGGSNRLGCLPVELSSNRNHYRPIQLLDGPVFLDEFFWSKSILSPLLTASCIFILEKKNQIQRISQLSKSVQYRSHGSIPDGFVRRDNLSQHGSHM